ncbi:MAG: hypothetical protein AAF689_07865 [Pseudomonadota bacterium]
MKTGRPGALADGMGSAFISINAIRGSDECAARRVMQRRSKFAAPLVVAGCD